MPWIVTTDFTIFYGIGAAKAGTTWLFDFLRGHPDCIFSNLKEVHHFDYRYLPLFKRERQELAAELRRRRLLYPLTWGRKRKKNAERIEFCEMKNPSEVGSAAANRRYLDFLTRNRKQERIVGDISPGYGMLGREHFVEMAGLASTTKFIYLMRDPVDRFWSAVKMRSRKHNGRDYTHQNALELFDTEIIDGKEQLLKRSDYCRAVTELEAAIPQEDRLVLFSEHLFDKDQSDRITDFLGIAAHPANTGRKANEGKSFKLDEERIARTVRKLAGQYEFVFEHFGNQIPENWHQRYAMLGDMAAAESA